VYKVQSIVVVVVPLSKFVIVSPGRVVQCRDASQTTLQSQTANNEIISKTTQYCWGGLVGRRRSCY